MAGMDRKEFNKVNQKMKDEKECLLNHYTALKRLLGRIKHHERDNLKVLNHHDIVKTCQKRWEAS